MWLSSLRERLRAMRRWGQPIQDQQVPQLVEHLELTARKLGAPLLGGLLPPAFLLMILQGPWDGAPASWAALGLYLLGVAALSLAVHRGPHRLRWMAWLGALHMSTLLVFPLLSGQPLLSYTHFLVGVPWAVALLAPGRPVRVMAYSLLLCGFYVASAVWVPYPHAYTLADWGNVLLVHLIAAGVAAQVQRRVWRIYAQRTAQKTSADRLAQLGRRTAGLCHEFKGPLATTMQHLVVTRGLLEEYQESLGHPAVTPEDLREIQQEMDRSLRLGQDSAQQMQLFLRSMQRQLQIHEGVPTGLSLVHYVEEALERAQARLGQRGIQIERHFTAQRLELRGDPQLLRRLLDNLLDNALDAMEDQPGARLRLELRRDEHRALFSVQDSGPGVPEHLKERIFEPMFSTRPRQSTGMGLAMCRDIARGLFGGDLRLEPSPQGARFTFDAQLSL